MALRKFLILRRPRKRPSRRTHGAAAANQGFLAQPRRFTHRRCPKWAHLRHAPSSCSLEASCSDQASKAWSTSSQVFSVFSAKAVVPPRLSTASQSKVPVVASLAQPSAAPGRAKKRGAGCARRECAGPGTGGRGERLLRKKPRHGLHVPYFLGPPADELTGLKQPAAARLSASGKGADHRQ